METIQEPSAPDSSPGWRIRLPRWATVCEASVFLAFVLFFLLYGQTPLVGGDNLGLVGADEPRYAQIAHEMLDRFDSVPTLDKLSDCVSWKGKLSNFVTWSGCHRYLDSLGPALKSKLSACVTPYLYGKPWLEKPALYYWRAMFVFQDFGVHDWVARLPSATFAFLMVALIYLHMRRFRPGGHLDAALITVACAGIIGFARGASTDMQMAAPLAIGLLGWYAWYETDSKFWLFDIYFFTGVATLAKGPIAPVLAFTIVAAFAFLRREWSLLRRSFWWPGVLLYFAIVLPWFIAVQHQNPDFFRVFFLEHNLERFATDRYEHQQPFWYYLAVALLALMPWTVIAVRAMIDGIRTSVCEWRTRHFSRCKQCPGQPGDAFPEFLILWALIPIVFFSFSQSKLPGYILPSLPPITILTGDFIARRRKYGIQLWVLVSHAAVCGVMTMVVLLLPWFVIHNPKMPPLSSLGGDQILAFIRECGSECIRIMPPWPSLTVAVLASAGASLLIIIVVKGFGAVRLRLVTTAVLVVLVLYLYGVGPVFGIPAIGATKQVAHLLDRSYSARPLAERLAASAPADETVAVFRVRRDVEFGLSFYRNREVVNYTVKGVPEQQHLLVAQVTGRGGVDLHTTAALEELLGDRHYEQLFSWPEQGLMVYKVGSR